MRAMILAAGLGTRLMPLTSKVPKPLFPVYNIPIIQIIIRQLRELSVTNLAINTHWLASQIKDYIEAQDFKDIHIDIRDESEILGTAGGIKNFESFWKDEPFFVVTADTLHNIDMVSFFDFHLRSKNLVTLILHDYPRFNQVELDAKGSIVGLRGERLKEPSSDVSLLAFTGIHIISPELLKEIPQGEKVDIISLYKELIHKGAAIKGVRVTGHYWAEIGSSLSYHQVHSNIYEDESEKRLNIFNDLTFPCIGPNGSVNEDARFEGYVSIGSNARIGKGCTIRDSIIWDNVRVADCLSIENCIIAHGVNVKTDLKDGVIIGA
ncbi:MAG: NDP-sugar synthase [Thermodesulfobacteriota bacterium]|nr:NDP-sugar synthase [Thermodesulfobacteriota bacterium]